MRAVIFKKPISYCRFVSADPERTSVAHTQCTYTGGALTPFPKDCGRGSLGPGTGCHPALHSFIKLVYSAECQARATQSLPHTAPRPAQSQAQRNIVGYGR